MKIDGGKPSSSVFVRRTLHAFSDRVRFRLCRASRRCRVRLALLSPSFSSGVRYAGFASAARTPFDLRCPFRRTDRMRWSRRIRFVVVNRA